MTIAIDRRTATLAISEVFGPTFQGEGPSTGRRAVFIRLGGCNLACTWCDTPYTWDWTGRNGQKYDPKTEVRMWTAEALQRDVLRRFGDEQGVLLLVISGGEPLLQQEALAACLPVIVATPRIRVEIETNGTLAPSKVLSQWVSAFNISPKLAHSKANAGLRIGRINPVALAAFWKQHSAEIRLKFVCQTPLDIAEVEHTLSLIADTWLSEFAEPALRARVRPARMAQLRAATWIMPEGRTPMEITERTRDLAPVALAAGFRFTTRLHVLIWGAQRGV